MNGAILIDAGYLYAAVGQLLTGRASRDRIHLDAASAIAMLRDSFPFGQDATFFLFDAASGRIATTSQQRWASAGARLRMGLLHGGAQVDVDDRIVRTCVGLARCQKVPQIVIITGDSDFVPAIRDSIGSGARVEVVSVAGINFSKRLARIASNVRSLDRSDVMRFARPVV